MKKQNNGLWVSIIIIIILVVGVILLNKSPKVADLPGPTPDETLGWKSATDNGVTFKYPETLGTKYITTANWPPKVKVVNGPFTCTETGSPTAEAGQTLKKTINGHVYCVTIKTEGAAGSVYNQYSYGLAMGNKVANFTFTTKAVQCGNYDETEKAACESERASFNIDTIADKIIQSAVMSSDTTSSIVGCYVGGNEKDIYTLNVKTVSGENFSGTLSFKNFEKDSSSGTYSGTYKNGVLLGDYAFKSEGMDSNMQVAFKKSGDDFVQGYGEVDTNGEKFKDVNSITYSSATPLSLFKNGEYVVS